MTVELNIYHAVNRLEALKGERLTDNQIATATGLHRHTIAAIRKGREDKTLSKLLDFFQSEGLPVTVNDLFTVSDAQPINPKG